MRDQVVELLHAERKPVSVREIVKRLRLEGDQRKELKSVLKKLIEDGEVVNVRGARVGLPDRMNLLVGRLSCSPSGYGFVVPEQGTRNDVYVSAVNMKEALHGDRVVVRVERQTPKGPEGRIIRVLERALQRIVGRYEEDGRFGGHVVPFDKRLLHELFIPPGQDGGATSGQMVSAEITRPPTATRNPAGRVLEVLGRLEDKGVDLKVVMAKHALPDAFPPEVEEQAARVPQVVRDEDRAGRTDFRPWPTITVDPETARDHDDAISLDRMGNGHWLLGVHIADVAHYVPEGTPLDQEAYLRGTSVYFPDRVVPMLPHALSSRICSLVEDEDRLVQSVVLEIDGKGRVVRSEFHDGVIRSAARLSYQQAQAMVDGDPAVRERHAPLVGLVQRMDELAKLMRARRYQRGSLDFDQPEPKLVLDESGEVTGIVAPPRLDSMRVIEEFMLAANEAVAEKLASAGHGALFRIHEQPDPERVEEFRDLVASLGYRIPGDLTEIRQQDFQRILRQIEGKPEERLVSYLLLRTMKLARYHEENLGHFGLATEMYAHFTSPIRRYPDLVVHRALRALRSGQPSETPVERLAEMGRHLSERERIATEAERELNEWKKVRFMAGKVGETFEGYVTGVQSFGLFVEIQDVYVQGLVHVSSMNDDYYAFDERTHTLSGANVGRVYRLGDPVRVQVARVDLEQRKVDFALLDVLERTGGRRGRAGRDPRPPVREGGHRPPARSGRRPEPEGRSKRGGARATSGRGSAPRSRTSGPRRSKGGGKRPR
jgi:ribonuclease R